MKKLFIVSLIALFVLGAVATGYAVNASGPGYSGDVMGMQGRYASDAHRTFRLVRNGPASASNPTSASKLTAGDIVIWDTSASPYAADGVSVCLSSTTGDSRVAGVIITAVNTSDSSTNSARGATGITTATEDVGRDNWGWLQTYGLSTVEVTCATVVYIPGSIAVGEAIGVSAQSGKVGEFLASTSAATANGNAGFGAAAISAGGTGYVFLKCE